MKTKISTKQRVFEALDRLTVKGVNPINYSTIARVVKKDPATVRYHVQNMVKGKLLKRNKKTGHIEFRD